MNRAVLILATETEASLSKSFTAGEDRRALLTETLRNV
jgi:hypothetical protein